MKKGKKQFIKQIARWESVSAKLLSLLLTVVFILSTSIKVFAVTGSQVAADGMYSTSITAYKEGKASKYATINVYVVDGLISDLTFSGSDAKDFKKYLMGEKGTEGMLYLNKTASPNAVDAVSSATQGKAKYTIDLKSTIKTALSQADERAGSSGDIDTSDPLTDGTYTKDFTAGDGKYTATVTITVSGGKITDVSVNNNGSGDWTAPLADARNNLIGKSSLADVDAISSATQYSQALEDAITAALYGEKENTDPVLGTYTATVTAEKTKDGKTKTATVNVTLSNGKISRISFTGSDADDFEKYLKVAKTGSNKYNMSWYEALVGNEVSEDLVVDATSSASLKNETTSSKYKTNLQQALLLALEPVLAQQKLLEPTISDPAQTYIKGSGNSITITSSADYANFVRVEMDGNKVDSNNYTVRSGSTVVTLKNTYLDTLTNGDHTVSIVSEAGSTYKAGSPSLKLTVQADETRYTSDETISGKTFYGDVYVKDCIVQFTDCTFYGAVISEDDGVPYLASGCTIYDSDTGYGMGIGNGLASIQTNQEWAYTLNWPTSTSTADGNTTATKTSQNITSATSPMEYSGGGASALKLSGTPTTEGYYIYQSTATYTGSLGTATFNIPFVVYAYEAEEPSKGGNSDTTTGSAVIRVNKVWSDGSAAHSGDSVEVGIYEEGKTTAVRAVNLSSSNEWTADWDQADSSKKYYVKEEQVPAGYEDSITSETITEGSENESVTEASVFEDGGIYVLTSGSNVLTRYNYNNGDTINYLHTVSKSVDDVTDVDKWVATKAFTKSGYPNVDYFTLKNVSTGETLGYSETYFDVGNSIIYVALVNGTMRAVTSNSGSVGYVKDDSDGDYNFSAYSSMSASSIKAYKISEGSSTTVTSYTITNTKKETGGSSGGGSGFGDDPTDGESVVVSKTVDKSEGKIGDEFSLTMEAYATAKEIVNQETTSSADICLVLDLSQSMTDSRLASLKEGVNAFLKALPDGTEVGVVTFSNTASRAQTIKTPYTYSSFSRSSASGTVMGAAITNAQSWLASTSSNIPDYMVVFTDGYPEAANSGSDEAQWYNAISAAAEAKKDGTKIYAISVAEGADTSVEPEKDNYTLTGMTFFGYAAGDTNVVMQCISSNYPNAQATNYSDNTSVSIDPGTKASSNYYATPGGTDWKNAFVSIANETVSFETIDLSAAVMKDAINTDIFDVTEAKAEAVVWDYDNGYWTPTSTKPTAKIDANGVATVSGFDYSKHYLSGTKEAPDGAQKVVLTISGLKAKKSTDGQTANTNKDPQGIYENDSASTAVKAFESPKVTIETLTYTLSYDANGGSGAPDDQTQTSDEESVEFDISNNAPTREGFTFLGWADSSDAEKANVTEKVTVTSDNDNLSKTLYAVWQENKVSLTYNGNAEGDTVSNMPNPYSVEIVKGDEVTITDAVPTRTGFIFKGWADSADATEAVYEAGDDLEVNENKTIYAVWEQSYRLIFEDYTKGGVKIDGVELTSIEGHENCYIGTAYVNGNVNFKLSADLATVAAVHTDDAGMSYDKLKDENGNFERLYCSADHTFTVNVSGGDVYVVLAYKGDVNLDSSIGLMDANLADRIFVKTYTAVTNLKKLVSDVNADGDVGLMDSNIIDRSFVKLYTIPWDVKK